MAVPPPATFIASFAVSGPDAVTIGRKAIAYARALGGDVYTVTSFTVSPVSLVGQQDPASLEPSGLTWSVQVTATLTLNPPPAQEEPPAQEPAPTEEPPA